MKSLDRILNKLWKIQESAKNDRKILKNTERLIESFILVSAEKEERVLMMNRRAYWT